MDGASAQAEMPKYKSHKTVWALKIAKIEHVPTPANQESDGSRYLYPADEGYGPVLVDHEYMRKHNPQAGGYYVVYADGYKSFSPAQAFEEGYTRL